MVRVATGFALEDVPMTIGCLGVSASRAAFGRIPGVDLDHGHAQFCGFIAQEEEELTVRPTVYLGALCFAKLAVSNAVKFFDRDRWASGGLCESDDRSTDLMIDSLHESFLSTSQPFEHLRDGARRMLCLLLLERRTNTQIAVANVLGVASTTHPTTFAVGCAGENVDALIDADDRVVWGKLIENSLFEAQRQEDLPSFAANGQASIAENPVINLVLKTRRTRERDVLDTPIDGPNRQATRVKRYVTSTLPALEDDGLRSKLTRVFDLVFVGPDGSVLTSNVSDTGAGNLGRKPSRSCCAIGECVQSNCIGQFTVIKGYLTNEVAGDRPCGDSSFCYIVRQRDLELDGANDFRHIMNLSLLDGKSKETGIPPPAKAGGPLPGKIMANDSTLTITVEEGSVEWCNKLRERARKLVQERDMGFLELGEILYRVTTTPLDGDSKNPDICTLWGYQDIGEWADKELGIGRRTAERYRYIWKFLEITLEGKLPMSLRHRYTAIGYSKAYNLAKVITLENAEGWIEMGEELSYKDLQAAISDAIQRQRVIEAEEERKAAEDEALGEERAPTKRRPDPPALSKLVAHFRSKHFRLAPEQFDNVDLALTRANELTQTGKSGHNLDMICTDFLSTNQFRSPGVAVSDMYLTYLVKFERIFGKWIVVVDPKSHQIEYGIDALKKVAGVQE